MLSVEETHNQVERFYNAHKGLGDVTFLIAETQEDAFPAAPEEWHENNTPTGAYLPANNTVVIVANNNRDIKELNKTLRHEVFGHLALNRISEDDKMNLLNTIADAPNDSEIGKHRNELSKMYGGFENDQLKLAEEVFSHTAEKSYATIERFESVPDPTYIKTEDDLLDFIHALKNGIHHGALKQQIFPQSNDAQFRKIDTKPSEVIALAEASKDVYRDTSESNLIMPLTQREIIEKGITVPLELKKIGAKAEIYKDSKENIILSYRGTESMKDWWYGNTQSLGIYSSQYKHAVELGKQVYDAYGDRLLITGHSLGGGKSSLVSAITGAPSITFNSAGLHSSLLKKEVEHFTKHKRSQIENNIESYVVKGEILNLFQDYTFSPKALGKRETIIDPLNPNMLTKHSMDSVIRSLKNEMSKNILLDSNFSHTTSLELAQIIRVEKDIAFLSALEENSDPIIKKALALNFHTPTAMLYKLSKSKESDVRKAIVANEGTPLDAIYELSKDGNIDIKNLAAERLWREENIELDKIKAKYPTLDIDIGEHKDFETFIFSSIASELQTDNRLSEITKERIASYGELLGDKYLHDSMKNNDYDVVDIGEYFKHLSEDEYVSFEMYQDQTEENNFNRY